MEDAQAPNAAVIHEYWPNNDNGIMFKNHIWFEGDVAPQSNGYMNVNNMSDSVLGRFTTTINGVTNPYKLARYRWMWWIRQWPVSANDFSQLFALIDAANTPTTSPAYYANMESQVDTENWLRLSAIEHATGDLDSFFTLVMWNMYNYRPPGGKWTAIKWDWNISLGSGTSPGWGPDGSQLFNYGSLDPVMAAFHNYPPYQRAYLRGFLDIANLAMNNAAINPMLDAKYAAFAANGLNATSFNGLIVQDPAAQGGLESWIGAMHNSLLAALTNSGVANVPFAATATVASNGLAYISGTAPLPVKTVWVNGVPWPVTWTTTTNWLTTVPLKPGSNPLSVLGVGLNGHPVPGATGAASVVYSGAAPAPAGQVVINEIMYNPPLPNAQYVELYNLATNLAFDLSGWQIPNLGYTFPAGSVIGPNSFLVLAADRTAFASAYGGTVPIFDTLSQSWPAGGQTLLLVCPASGTTTTNLLVAGVRYGNSPPWPAGANGLGSSLQLLDPRQDNWRAGNWAGAYPPAALSPGATNTVFTSLPAFPPLWLNELQAVNLTGITNRAGQRVPWLELYNPTANAVSLTGLYLANNYTNLTAWAFPAGAAINPGQFKIIFADGQTSLSTLAELHTSFTLGSPSGTLVLSRVYNGQAQVLDYLDYTNLAPNWSYGDSPDGQAFARQQFSTATPGGTNSTAVAPSFIPYAAANSVYSQDFNSLPNPGPVSVNSANPVTINGVTYSLANPFDFAAPVVASGGIGGLGLPLLAGWYGLADPDASVGSRFGASDGDQTAGGQISFGPPNSANRALGLLATSSTGFTALGGRFVNQTTNSLNCINLQFTGEIWRQSDKPKTLEFYYLVDATGTNAFSTNATAFLPALNVSFPTNAADAGGVAVDGTALLNQTNLSASAQIISNWPPGAALWLVWEMADPTGKAQGLAIDNLSFSAWTATNSPPTPGPAVSVSLSGNQFTLAWPTVSGYTYQIQYKGALTDPTWLPLGNPLLGAGALLATNDFLTATQRFYRLSVGP